MDKSLKKLRKSELRELLFDVVDENEKLIAENERLKRMLAQRRLPRNATVGSIAQAALQANGYFEAAQRSADEYLREIKHLRDELVLKSKASPSRESAAASEAQLQAAAQIQAQTEVRAQKTLDEAQKKARQIVAAAQAQARQIASAAQAQAAQPYVPVQERSNNEVRTQAPAQTPSAQTYAQTTQSTVRQGAHQRNQAQTSEQHAIEQRQASHAAQESDSLKRSGKRFPAHAVSESAAGFSQRGLRPSAAASR